VQLTILFYFIYSFKFNFIFWPVPNHSVEAKEVPPHLAEVLVMMLKVGPQQLYAPPPPSSLLLPPRLVQCRTNQPEGRRKAHAMQMNNNNYIT
jgi:hypothetical protein